MLEGPGVVTEYGARAHAVPVLLDHDDTAGHQGSGGLLNRLLAPRLHSSGVSSREHVMMRQPLSRKCMAVVWPMPRLAPVMMTDFLSMLSMSDRLEQMRIDLNR